MGLQNYRITDHNPNEDSGAGNCLCSEEGKPTGCDPPFVVFFAQEMASNADPHVVACADCILHAAEDLTEREELGVAPLETTNG